jgi:hypothetical protein
LKTKPSVSEIAGEVGEGIMREGVRCLNGPRDAIEGRRIAREFRESPSIEAILILTANVYTRDTFVYRRVNKFLRENSALDSETGRNLGVYIGLLRECFCVYGETNPLKWKDVPRLYRAGEFGIDTVMDYARRNGGVMRWPNFGSSSTEAKVALGFPGNVLFQVATGDPRPSLVEVSAFPDEQEYILSPYDWFSIEQVRWSEEYRRWIVAIGEAKRSPAPSWLFFDVAAAPAIPEEESKKEDGETVPE